MKRIIGLSVLGVFLFTGCAQYGGDARVDSGSHRVDNMPPPHAPAHGRRRQQYHYYYYPHAEFYFDVGRNMYFYLDSRGRWAVSVTLPYHLRHHLRDHYIELRMGSDKPYSEHHHHKKKYKKHKKAKPYHYYYYPHAEFYFDVGRNMYFYLDSRGRWAVSVTLPPHLRGHLRDRRFELRMESDRPYTEHRHHKKKYKKKKNNKGKDKDKRGKKKHDDDDKYRNR